MVYTKQLEEDFALLWADELVQFEVGTACTHISPEKPIYGSEVVNLFSKDFEYSGYLNFM